MFKTLKDLFHAFGLAMVAVAPTVGVLALAPQLVAFQVSQAHAADATPFTGRWQWDGPQTCAKDYDSDNVAMRIESQQIVFYETSCTITKSTKLGDKSYRLRMTCSGEGETEHSEMILATLPKSKVNDEMLLRIEPKTGFVQAFRRCP